MTTIQAIVDALTLEPIEVDLFRGWTPVSQRGRRHLFGGQVIAQALAAAYKTIEGRPCHSLQAYFIRPGDPKAPVLYEVERSRDGRSFATRRVIALQHGEPLLNMAASFHAEERGLSHQTPMEEAPPPDGLPGDAERWGQLPPALLEDLSLSDGQFAIETRHVDPVNPLAPQVMPPHQKIWFRAQSSVGDDPVLNQCLLAYATDMTLLTTSARPHGLSGFKGDQLASLDHAIWFHRPVDMGDWLLYDQHSPWSGGGRGFNRGSIYRRDGVMLASVAQEGVIRAKR